MTFDGAFHGRTLGALCLKRSKTIHRHQFHESPSIISAPYCCRNGECDCGWKTDGPGRNVIADELIPDNGVIHTDEGAYLFLALIQDGCGFRNPRENLVADPSSIQQE